VTFPTDSTRRIAWIRWGSLATIVVGLILTARQLPMERLGDALEGWLEGLGVWGPVAFAAIYVVAAVLFIPGSVLTLAGGAVFGLGVGTAAVSIGSTTGAAAAFLVARYAARESVAGMARSYPRFDAIDKAIGEGGWKIVALLRLVPFVPFNLQNYFYGLTSIRFWPCVLASWIAMLPGTFMYVYIGHLGRLAIAGDGGMSVGQWVLLGVGFVAVVAVSVYIPGVARRKISEQTRLADAGPDRTESERDAGQTTKGFPWGTAVTAVVAVAIAGLAVTANVRGEDLRAALGAIAGPPQAALAEAYQTRPDGPRVDHSGFDALLKRHVDADGWVDYRGLFKDSAGLDAYLELIAHTPFDELGRNEKLALLINAYNAFTLRLILDYSPQGRPVESIKVIPAKRRWDHRRWNVGGTLWSLNEIEHEQIRPKFKEPRIHFALVCAAVGCPPLRSEAYQAERLETQLESQTRYVHTHDRWFRFEETAGRVYLTKLYDWYGGDFEQQAGSVLAYVAGYDPKLEAALAREGEPQIVWLDYDWSLNDRSNREPGT
jgi:uncharacterized membrane protein YdjX (TVP38/TMEM64 family)